MYLLKITLLHIDPPIWRSAWIDENRPLEHLHYLVQFTFNWQLSHMYDFLKGKKVYDMAGTEPEFSMGEDMSEFTIKDVLTKVKDSLKYEYDFGDNWVHKIEVLEIGDMLVRHEPFLVDGARNGPPEDCGGVPGYENLVELMKGPNNADRQSMVEWMDGEFDPEKLDMREINEILADFDGHIEDHESLIDFDDDDLF